MGTRWTPFAVLVAVLAAVLLGAGVVAVVAHEDDDDRPSNEALGGGDVTTTIITLPPETTTSTTGEPVTTTSSAPTTVDRTTTTRSGQTTTTRRTTTTRGPGQPTTSTPPLCGADQIDIRANPDRLTYPAGQPVGLSTTIRNRSSAPCFYRGYNVEMRFLDPAGQTIIAQVVHADDIVFQTFAPGQSITHTATWDPRQCATPPCPLPTPDIYAIQAVWSFSGGTYTARQQYVLS